MSGAEGQTYDDLSSDGIPPELFTLAERVDTLRNVMYIFRGWNADIDVLKQSVISALASWKQSIKHSRNVLQQLDLQSKSYEVCVQH